MRRFLYLVTKKCRIYAACGVSQTPNNKYAEKELGRVLYLLDRNIDNVKSAILGKIFNAYVNGKM